MFKRNTALYITVYFVQAIFSIAGIAKMIYLQQEISLSVGQIATLESLIIIPWTIKPLYGIISDLLPIKRLKRKPYIFLASLLASAGWMYLSLGAQSYHQVLFALLIGAIGLAFTDVATDGLIVESSTIENVGKLQSICWGSFAVAAVIGSLYSGQILSFLSSKQVFFIAGLFPLITVTLSLFIKETPKEKTVEKSTMHFIKTAGRALMQRKILIAALFVFLWNIAPAIGTPLFFRMKDVLLFQESTIGYFSAFNGVGMIAGAILFGKYFDRFNLKKVLLWTVIINATSALLVFLLYTELSGYILFFLFGITFQIAWLPILKLAAEICPKGVEATLFALLASIMNLGKAFSEYLGGQLFELLNFEWLVIISALATLLTIPLIPLLKTADREKDMHTQLA